MGKIITITDCLDLALLELGAVFVDLVADGLLTDVEIFRKRLVRVPMQCHQTAKQCFIHAVTLFPDLPSSVQGGHPLQTGEAPVSAICNYDYTSFYNQKPECTPNLYDQGSLSEAAYVHFLHTLHDM